MTVPQKERKKDGANEESDNFDDDSDDYNNANYEKKKKPIKQTRNKKRMKSVTIYISKT